jgi:hypothetical protein
MLTASMTTSNKKTPKPIDAWDRDKHHEFQLDLYFKVEDR